MSVRETTLAGSDILSIGSATPSGADLELRTARRGQINASLSRNNQVDIYVNSIHVSQVMVGRITAELSCLYIGPVSIDITPDTATIVDAWLGKQLKAISA